MAAPADEKGTDSPQEITDLRSYVLSYDDSESELVPVPGWGDAKFLVKGLSALERADFLKRCSTQQKDGTLYVDMVKYWPDLVIRTAHDPKTGELVFQPTDRDALNRKMAKNLQEVAAVARRLSGLEDNSQAEAKSESNSDA